jgi:hypothetical protein
MPGTRTSVIVRLPLFVFFRRLDATISVSEDGSISNRREADKLHVNDEYISEGVWQRLGSHPTDVQTTDSTSESSVRRRSQDDGDTTHQVVDTLDEDYVEANRWAM